MEKQNWSVNQRGRTRGRGGQWQRWEVVSRGDRAVSSSDFRGSGDGYAYSGESSSPSPSQQRTWQCRSSGPSTAGGGVGENWGRSRGVGSSSGGDGGRGRGRNIVQYVPVGQQRLADPLTSIHPELERMDISESARQSSLPAGTELTPCKRPDSGGKSAVRLVKNLVNYFPVKFDPQCTILQYDVDIKPVAQGHQRGSIEFSKVDLSMIKNKLFSMDPAQFPLSKTAFDGERIIYSSVELPTGIFDVDLPRGRGLNAHYECTIKLVNELSLGQLEAFLNGNLSLVPRQILQGMDLIMKQNQNRLRIGRCFYSPHFDSKDDLGNGIYASRGYQHSLKTTAQGLVLNVDYSVLPFIKPIGVLDFLRFTLQIDYQNGISPWQKKQIEDALKGLKVIVTHRKTKQKFTISGLTKENINDIVFPLDDSEDKTQLKRVKLVDYFVDKYKKPIKHRNLPSLDLSKNGKMNYVPMEFCELIEGQKYPKEELKGEEGRRFRRISLADPGDRRDKIREIVQARDGPTGGDCAKSFNIQVSSKMTEVSARIIKPPDLRLGDSQGRSIKCPITREDCQWSFMDKYVPLGRQIEQWVILDLSEGRLNSDRFVKSLIAQSSKLGIFMKEPVYYKCRMYVLSNSDDLRGLLRHIHSKAHRLQILVCVMSRKDSGYKNLKWISETEIGILTQCSLVWHANEHKEQYLSNLALKINAKLGGSNVELFDRLPYFEGDGHVMFIGADVNHPPPRNTSCPSIAAVVATMNWPAANRYAARIRPQEHRKEAIQNFGDMCLELIQTYGRLHGVKPEKIVVFRDGVSDGQFLMVLNEELMDLKRTLESDGCSPTVTVVVAQKRHQTRLFPKDGNRKANVSPGTVVDHTIVHPQDFDFYLCSHHGTLGTSKPCHYTVIYDEHGFSSDEIQRLIYDLCYTYARCTKPVSLVPPIYYADLVAYRGRLYQEALTGYSPLSIASSASVSSSTLSPSSISSFSERAFKLHGNLENAMFFC
ncbi:hypothetical protein Sjap_003800 [Stephania japonica]|uniref:Protein argonaute 2-like n=1 Tax=Stephania japonica TaxID=461633 RepID=A0AAP0KQG4_9MAGN